MAPHFFKSYLQNMIGFFICSLSEKKIKVCYQSIEYYFLWLKKFGTWVCLKIFNRSVVDPFHFFFKTYPGLVSKGLSFFKKPNQKIFLFHRRTSPKAPPFLFGIGAIARYFLIENRAPLLY